MANARAVTNRSQVVAAAFVSSILIVMGVWFWGFSSPDRLLERSYARVAPHGTLYLDDMGPDSQPPLRITPAAATGAMPQTAVVVVNGVASPSGILNEPLAVGERVRIRTGAVGSREIVVRDVAELDVPVVGLPGVRLQLVTARSTGRNATDALQLVFAIRDHEPLKIVPAVVPGHGRTL